MTQIKNSDIVDAPIDIYRNKAKADSIKYGTPLSKRGFTKPLHPRKMAKLRKQYNQPVRTTKKTFAAIEKFITSRTHTKTTSPGVLQRLVDRFKGAK